MYLLSLMTHPKEWSTTASMSSSLTPLPDLRLPAMFGGSQPPRTGGELPESSRWFRCATTCQATLGLRAAEPPGSQNSGSQAEAQWAIAAALERLADVIVAALNPAEATGRHAAGPDKRS